MDRKGKYFNTIYIGSGLITAAGVMLVLAKIYGYIGLILLFFGGESIIMRKSTRTSALSISKIRDRGR
jgi:hypothetical protein